MRIRAFLVVCLGMGTSIPFARSSPAGPGPDLEVRAVLGRYVGTWEGRYAVRLPGGDPLEVISVRATYEWKADRVVGVLERTVGSEKETLDVELGMGEAGLWMRMETPEATDPYQWYRGEVHSNAIEWVPVREDPEAEGKRGILRDYFLLTREGRRQIATRAVQSVLLDDGTRVTLQLEGFLIPRDESGVGDGGGTDLSVEPDAQE